MIDIPSDQVPKNGFGAGFAPQVNDATSAVDITHAATAARRRRAWRFIARIVTPIGAKFYFN
jgi:hypothetical protein